MTGSDDEGHDAYMERMKAEGKQRDDDDDDDDDDDSSGTTSVHTRRTPAQCHSTPAQFMLWIIIVRRDYSRRDYLNCN